MPPNTLEGINLGNDVLEMLIRTWNEEAKKLLPKGVRKVWYCDRPVIVMCLFGPVNCTVHLGLGSGAAGGDALLYCTLLLNMQSFAILRGNAGQ